MNLFSTHVRTFTCTDPARWAVRTRSPIQMHKQKMKMTTAAITTPQWQRVVLTTMLITLRSSWQRKCKLLKWGEWERGEEGEEGEEREEEDDTHWQKNEHTQYTEVVCPVSDPSSLEQMNHGWTQMEWGQVVIFYSMRESLFKLLNWLWSRVWQWDKLNNPPIIIF